MIIGVPKEIKNNEYRVAIAPSGVRSLVENRHKVIIQRSSGEGAGISDLEFLEAGATISPSAEDIFKEAEMIVKVKEPLPQEYSLLQSDQILFTFLHLAAAPELTKALLERRVIAVAYETVQMENGSLPLLTPMSEIAGKLSIQAGAHYLEKEKGGRGVLLGGVPGLKPSNVTIIGGGTVGLNAAKIALGMGANVTIIDTNLDRLRYLSDILSGRLTLLVSNTQNIAEAVITSDLVIGALLVPGARAKKVITRGMVVRMKQGSVLVDVAIDQGGCAETSLPTTFDNPVYSVDGVIHYCVSNMPGSVARTSTFALTNATCPYVVELANLGYEEAMYRDIHLMRGLNVFKGKVTNKAVSDALGLQYFPYETAGNTL